MCFPFDFVYRRKYVCILLPLIHVLAFQLEVQVPEVQLLQFSGPEVSKVHTEFWVYPPPNSTRVNKSKQMRWAGHVFHMEQ